VLVSWSSTYGVVPTTVIDRVVVAVPGKIARRLLHGGAVVALAVRTDGGLRRGGGVHRAVDADGDLRVLALVGDGLGALGPDAADRRERARPE
jgi:hypothetical protein